MSAGLCVAACVPMMDRGCEPDDRAEDKEAVGAMSRERLLAVAIAAWLVAVVAVAAAVTWARADRGPVVACRMDGNVCAGFTPAAGG
jgi:hypothetical protein